MQQTKRKQQSFEYGAMILLTSTMLVKFIGAIFKIPLAGLIGDLGFGYFSSAYDLFTPIYALAMAGLPIAISRVVAENMAVGKYRDVREALKVTKRIFLITGLSGLIIMLLLIYPFVKITDPTGDTIYSLFAIAPALLFCCTMSTYRGYYEGLRNMYPTAISDVTEALGKLILGFGFAFVTMKLTHNVAYAAAAAMLGITVGAAAAALYLRLRYKIKGDAITEYELLNSPEPASSRTTAKILITIAIPVVLSSLANNVASLVDVSMVKWQLVHLVEENADMFREMYSSSIADYNNLNPTAQLTNEAIPTFLYGIRSKAFTMYNLVPAITSVLGVSALPVIASFWSVKNKQGIKRNLESVMKMTAIISLAAGMGFVFIGNGVMGLMYKTVASVAIGGPMMVIYGAAACFAGMSIPLTNVLQAVDKQVIALRNVAIGAVLKVVVNFIFVGIPTINIKGAAIGTAVSYAFIFFANLFSIIKYTGVVPNVFKTIIKPLIAAVSCGLTASIIVNFLGFDKLYVAFAILCGAVVYFIMLFVLNTFEEEDVLALPKGEKLLKICLKLRLIRKK